MDILLVRTFLEIAATGSFVAASKRLFVTQSAVSLRVQKLEASLGRTLFERSKAGAELTPAGREFERYALSMLKVWEEARQQIAIPEGFTESIHIGAQYSLWPRLGFRWIDALRRAMPEISIRAELGMPDRLTRFLIEGVTQMALLYTPQARPGLQLEQILEEELVLVAAWPEPDMDIAGRYAFVDWGPEFVHAHALHLPELTNPGLTLALGALSAEYIIGRELAAYLPARAVKTHLDSGRLHLVPGAPSFPYPAWAAWREDMDEGILAEALAQLRHVAANADAEQEAVMGDLAELSEDGEVATLGDHVETLPGSSS
ncbi:LysR family transcriptional regulator [Paralimibaculum aggregatum]|nr:LysR family transcriptional regulator [Limibaculum sp. NKW23]